MCVPYVIPLHYVQVELVIHTPYAPMYTNRGILSMNYIIKVYLKAHAV